MEHPTRLAHEVAALLESDPIMARQLKEHLGESKLLDLLEIVPEETTPERNDNGDIDLDELVKEVPLSVVLAAYRNKGHHP